LTEYQWVSLVALVAWLVLALTAFRRRRVSAETTLTMVIAWLGIFVVVILAFSWLTEA
jgi:hypothetical protein